MIVLAQNYILLERIELAASAASVSFSNIPQSGYTDLKVVFSVRADSSTNDSKIEFNGITTGYTERAVGGNGASTYSFNDGLINPLVNPSTFTANTFTNSEMYIPNYTSNNPKSISLDVVQENNATTANGIMSAALWTYTGNPAITSIKISPSTGNYVSGSTFSLYGLAAVGTTPAIAPKATGGNIQTDGTYWYHTFLASGTFTPDQPLTCNYLVVAGGGGGGGGSGGGGGAGGLRSTVGTTGGGGSLESPISVAATPYAITVGAGGAGSTGSFGSNGGSSTFSTITAIGGGGGGANANFPDGSGQLGGSGGGGGGSGAAGAGTANQGYAGGTGGSLTPYYGRGAGGGAGGAGTNSTTTNGGVGGTGVQITALATPTGTGASGYYAGGGGGSTYNAGTPGTGGAGGGGIGGIANTSTYAANGTANTGGGAGGGDINSSYAAAAGGSGLVIIRYPIA